jgi:Na+/pantothenate symporter
VTAAAATALALAAGSVVTLWKVMGSVGTPVLLLPLALAHTGRRASARRAVAAMAGAGAVSSVWLLLGRGAPWHGIEAIFPGLLVSAAVLAPAWRPGARKKEGTG